VNIQVANGSCILQVSIELIAHKFASSVASKAGYAARVAMDSNPHFISFVGLEGF
jgi:hypothetical protein